MKKILLAIVLAFGVTNVTADDYTFENFSRILMNPNFQHEVYGEMLDPEVRNVQADVLTGNANRRTVAGYVGHEVDDSAEAVKAIEGNGTIIENILKRYGMRFD